jgi:hypothetical protein
MFKNIISRLSWMESVKLKITVRGVSSPGPDLK